jgi:hypothetical protein
MKNESDFEIQELTNQLVHVRDDMKVILSSCEPSMRKIKDNSIKLSHLQVRVKLHRFRINSMQNCGPQSFELCYIRFSFAILAR